MRRVGGRGSCRAYCVYSAPSEPQASRHHIIIGTTGVVDQPTSLILQKDIPSCGVTVTSQGGIPQQGGPLGGQRGRGFRRQAPGSLLTPSSSAKPQTFCSLALERWQRRSFCGPRRHRGPLPRPRGPGLPAGHGTHQTYAQGPQQRASPDWPHRPPVVGGFKCKSSYLQSVGSFHYCSLNKATPDLFPRVLQ